MAVDRIAVAQRGVAYADVVGPPAKARSAGSKKRKTGSRKRAAGPRAAGSLSGPLLSLGSLTTAERLRLVDGIETVLEGVYTHLPLKRARYGFDPIQRLRILRSQVGELSDDGFHIELADIVTRLRDAHTRYAGPSSLADKVAALPFLVEMFGSADAPTYVVTKVGSGLDPAFKPGVVLEYWNGVPIDRAVQRYSDCEVGGRPDSQRAGAVQSLTLRSLQYGPPPDEYSLERQSGFDGQVHRSLEAAAILAIVSGRRPSRSLDSSHHDWTRSAGHSRGRAPGHVYNGGRHGDDHGGLSRGHQDG